MRSEPGAVNETVEEKKPEISIEEIREKGTKFQPTSSSVKLCTYLMSDELLLVDFMSGSSYLYSGVPESVWDGIIGAPSTGSYLHRCIRGQFHYKLLKKVDGKEVLA